MIMRMMSRAATALALAAAAVTTVGVTGAHADGPWENCPYGAVCIFPQNVKVLGGTTAPTDVFWSYGPHNLSNETGWHWVFNNQTPGAHAHLCNGYNGTQCGYDMADQDGVWADLTPVNSITLDRP
jgi:hypothetical protein